MNYKSTYRNVVVWVLAALVLITSISFGVDMHYCKDQLKTISLFSKAKTCHEKANKQDKSTCPFHQQMNKQEKNCCENHSVIVDAEHDLQDLTLSSLELDKVQHFVLAYTLIFHSKITTDKKSKEEFQYCSPVLHRDIYALSETYLL